VTYLLYTTYTVKSWSVHLTAAGSARVSAGTARARCGRCRRRLGRHGEHRQLFVECLALARRTMRSPRRRDERLESV